MEFSRQYLTRLAQESNFIKDTLEKVLRLSEILKFLFFPTTQEKFYKKFLNILTLKTVKKL